MGTETAIAWTDHTFNPWWGCSRVSPGCEHCYAETFAHRLGLTVWGKRADRRFFGDPHWNEPLRWNRAAERAGKPALVFCASMADVFEDRDDLIPWRERLLTELIPATPWLRWQLLTKRPENVARMVPSGWLDVERVMVLERRQPVAVTYGWPANVWIGTTVEDQQRANERLDHLVELPAPVRFLSCEPLLGPVDLSGWLFVGNLLRQVGSIDWIIVGGESGPRHRPLDLDNARRIRDLASDYEVPFFFKQVGGRTPTAGGDELDGLRWKELPEAAGR